MTTFTPDQWIIVGLVFVLGLLIGMFMTAGGRKKWKTRYNDEVARRKTLETEHRKQREEWETKERDWRDQDARRAAAIKGRGPDTDGDGVRDEADRKPADETRA
jgi:hypothetical protein